MTQRERLLEVIAVNVRYLVNLGSLSSFRRLEGIEELTGWMSNRSYSTHKRLADGIEALASVADRETLIQVAHGAAFYRHFNPKRRSDCGWDLAAMIADDALRACGVDVDKRNAKAERDEQRAFERRQSKRAAQEARAA